MPILGCSSLEEAFALQQAEEARAGRRGEFFDFIRSVPIVPIFATTPTREAFLKMANPMNKIKLLIHQAMSRPGKTRS